MREILNFPSEREKLLQHFNRERLADELQAATRHVLTFRYSHDEIGDGTPIMTCCPADDGIGIAVVFPDDGVNVTEAFAKAMDDHAELYRMLAESLRKVEAVR